MNIHRINIICFVDNDVEVYLHIGVGIHFNVDVNGSIVDK